MKIVSIVGTRPNFIKLAALVEELKKHRKMEHVLIHTGQHYDFLMSKLFFEQLGLPKPDEHLVCQTGVGADEQKKFLKAAIKEALKRQKPDLVIVVGDVNSTVAGAGAAKELGIRVAHVEAGLRSFDKSMPEEINRVQTDKISDFLFTTEESANKNLLNEGISKDKIFFVGNVMIDTIKNNEEKIKRSKVLDEFNLKKKEYLLITIHRQENVDSLENLEKIISIILDLKEKYKIVLPLHPRTENKLKENSLFDKLNDENNITLLPPVRYIDFINLEMNSLCVLTDSGGIQEETTVLGIPCLTLRNETERPITVTEGTNEIVGLNLNKIREGLLNLEFKNNKIPEFWDGKTSGRIVKIIFGGKN